MHQKHTRVYVLYMPTFMQIHPKSNSYKYKHTTIIQKFQSWNLKYTKLTSAFNTTHHHVECWFLLPRCMMLKVTTKIGTKGDGSGLWQISCSCHRRDVQHTTTSNRSPMVGKWMRGYRIHGRYHYMNWCRIVSKSMRIQCNDVFNLRLRSKCVWSKYYM